MAGNGNEDVVAAVADEPFVAPGARVRIAPELQQEIEQFLYLEAELLDDRQIAAWVELMTEDVRYFMPLRRNRGLRERDREYSADGDTAYFDESKASLRMRLAKLQTNVAWAEEPPSRSHFSTSSTSLPAVTWAAAGGASGNTSIAVAKMELNTRFLSGILRLGDEKANTVRIHLGRGEYKH